MFIYALSGVCQYKIYFLSSDWDAIRYIDGAEEKSFFEVPGRTVGSSAVEELAPVGFTSSFICSVSSLLYLLPHIA